MYYMAPFKWWYNILIMNQNMPIFPILYEETFAKYTAIQNI